MILWDWGRVKIHGKQRSPGENANAPPEVSVVASGKLGEPCGETSASPEGRFVTELRLAMPGPLHEASFIERPNRFVVHCRLANGSKTVRAHLPDPGRLRELLVPGRRLWLRHHDDPARRTAWSALLVQNVEGNGWVSIDTTLPNRLIELALRQKVLGEFRGWSYERREYPVGHSRFDFLLAHRDGRKMVLEVKSVTLVEHGIALFPDAVTARGRRHLEELSELAGNASWEASLLFVVQRADARRVKAARELDPDFADALQHARASGVKISARRCSVDPLAIALLDPIPVSR